MNSVIDPFDFAMETFGKTDLGDARRTQRLVDAAAALASHPGASIPVACANNGARVEGFYKLIRNDAVDADMIRRKLSTRMRQRLRVFYDAKAGFSGLGLGWASCGGVFSAA